MPAVAAEHRLPEPYLQGGGGRPLANALEISKPVARDEHGRPWVASAGGSYDLLKPANFDSYSIFFVCRLGDSPGRTHSMFARSGWTYNDFLQLRFDGNAIVLSGEDVGGSTGGFGRTAADPSLAANSPLLLSFRPLENNKCELRANSAPPAQTTAKLSARSFGAGYPRRPHFVGDIGELRVYPKLGPDLQQSVIKQLREYWKLPDAEDGFARGYLLNPASLDSSLHYSESGPLRLAWMDGAGLQGRPARLFVACSSAQSEISLADIDSKEVTARCSQFWRLQAYDTAQSRVALEFDLSTLPDLSLGDEGFYVLLYRPAETGRFEIVAESSAQDGQVVFRDVAPRDGYYTLGSTQGIELSEQPVAFTLNGAELGEGNRLLTGRRARLRCVAPAGSHLRLHDRKTGALWYDGPAADCDLEWWVIRAENLELSGHFPARTGYLEKIAPINISIEDEGLSYYPGLKGELKRIGPETPLLPETDFFKPDVPAVGCDVGDDAVMRAYPAYRTSESVRRVAFKEGGPGFQTADYFRTAVPHPSITGNGELIKEIGGCLYQPLGDINNVGLQLAVRISSNLIVEQSGRYRFRLESPMPLRLRIGAAEFSNASIVKDGEAEVAQVASEQEFELELERGLHHFELVGDRRNKEGGNIVVEWRPISVEDFVPLDGRHFVHAVPPEMQEPYRRFTSGFARRRWPKISPAQDMADARDFVAGLDPQAAVQNQGSFVATTDRLLNIYRNDRQLGGSPQVAGKILELLQARVAHLRAARDQAKRNGDVMSYFEKIAPFVEQYIDHPQLQWQALAARAAICSYPSVMLGRDFFSEAHSGTNDGYGDHHNFLVNVWRAARIWDDPLAFDAARSLYDSHFTYAPGTKDGLNSDDIFSFHTVNGRHLNMEGYGADWAGRVVNQLHFGTPWGMSREQYRRLAEFAMAFEWLYYKGAKAFTTAGRHNTHRGSVPGHFAERLLNLPREVFDEDTRRRLTQMVQRWKSKSPLEGNHFFFRHLQMIHRRHDFYIDVKMNAPLVGGIETFAGAQGGNLSFGDGVTTILRDGDEYRSIHAYDIPQSLWRFRSLPGTTQLSYEWGNDNPWQGLDRYRGGGGRRAGGVSNGLYGHCAFEFVSHGNNATRARKMFSFLEDGMFVLAAVITGGKPALAPHYSYKTNINQCGRKGAVKIVAASGESSEIAADVKEQTIELPLRQSYWIEQGEIGYLVIPTKSEQGPGQPGKLVVRVTDRTPINRLAEDVWAQPHMQGYRKVCEELLQGDNPRIAPVLEIWIDHGPQPQDASCAYMVCLRPKQAPVAEWLKSPPGVLLANSRERQVLRDKRTGTLHAFFYEPGVIESDDGRQLLAVDKPAALMLAPTGAGTAKLFCQDPVAATTRNLAAMSNVITVTLGSGAAAREYALQMPGAYDPDDRYRGGIVSRDVAR